MTLKEFLNVFDVCEMIVKRTWCYIGGESKEIIYARIDDPEDDEQVEKFYEDASKIDMAEIAGVYKNRFNGTIVIRLQK